MIRTPALFVHGSRDPFASPGELKDAIALIPGQVRLLEIDGAGHDLGRNHSDVALRIVGAFLQDCLR